MEDLQAGGLGPGAGLVGPKAGDPDVQGGQGAVVGQHFSNFAAKFLPFLGVEKQIFAVGRHHLAQDFRIGGETLDGQPVSLFEPPKEVVGFGKEAPGVVGEYPGGEARFDAEGHDGRTAQLAAGADGQAVPEAPVEVPQQGDGIREVLEFLQQDTP
jgi:hypothetical protein